VNRQLRQTREEGFQIKKAIRVAKLIMTKTDPGWRYYDKCNVQCTFARSSNANMLAFVDITSHILTPIQHHNQNDLENLHSWLLEGTEKETLTIQGCHGLCPKLLHTFGQMTYLTQYMAPAHEGSRMLVLGVQAIEETIISLRQRSEISEGYPNTDLLLQSCRLDQNGLVQSPEEVVNLTAEAWRQATLIYLRCRFYR
jgi:hypothetical protein